MSRADFYETMHLISAIQGLVNRKSPRLYTFFTDADQYWFDHMQSKEGFLENSTLKKITSIDELITEFQPTVAASGM